MVGLTLILHGTQSGQREVSGVKVVDKEEAAQRIYRRGSEGALGLQKKFHTLDLKQFNFSSSFPIQSV